MKVLSPAHNFLGLDEQHSNFEQSNIVIQQLPYEHTSSYRVGSHKGPKAILDASQFVEFYDEELDREICFEQGIATLEAINFKGKKNEQAVDLIEEHTASLLERNKFVVSLGAEHTVTFGTVKAFRKKYPGLSVLQIDAHSDLREAYEGNPLSHACVMKRVHDLGVSISMVGIRAQCKEEAKLIKDNATIHCGYAHERKGEWIKKAVDALSNEVYLTIDADGLDPSIMPAVGTPEPNGLLWQETLDLIRGVLDSGRKIVGMDLLEILPKEGEVLTQYNGAKLVYKVLGIVFG